MRGEEGLRRRFAGSLPVGAGARQIAKYVIRLSAIQQRFGVMRLKLKGLVKIGQCADMIIQQTFGDAAICIKERVMRL